MSELASSAAPSKARMITLWIVTGLLALMFAMAGCAKFVNPEMAEHFRLWGYADWFRDLIGLIEIAAAIALLIPRTAFYGAVALTVVMAGAVYTHLAHGEVPETVTPVVLLGLLGLIASARRPGLGSGHN
jgi:putative oxidoreductase